MASAIGWYIHATRKGYEQHGIQTHGNQPNKGWVAYSDVAKATMMGRMSHQVSDRAARLNALTKKEKKQLETVLSTMVRKVETGNFPQIVNEVSKTLQDELTQDLINVDWESLDITLSKPQDYYVGRSKLRENRSKILDTDFIINKIQQLQTALSLRIQDNLIDESVLEQANNLLMAYKQTITQLKGAMPTSLKNIKNKKIKQELENEYDQLLSLITTYAAWPSTAVAKGDLFEHTVGAILKTAAELGMHSIENVIVSGSEHNEYVTYDRAQFEGYKGENITNGNSRFYTDPKPVQGKVDVSFTWHAKDVRASLKNYNLENNSWIKLTDNSSMAYMLQYEDHDFVNHYLNLWSSYKNAKLSATYQLRKADAAKSMKLLLFYKALTGANLGNRKSANLLIINDISKKQQGAVKIFTPLEIIQQVVRSENALASVSVDGTNIMNMPLFPNTWHIEGANKSIKSMKAAEIRIANLLAELHRRKITAAISPAAFK